MATSIMEQIRVDPQSERIFEWTEYIMESTGRIAPTAEPVSTSYVERYGCIRSHTGLFNWTEYLKE